MVCKLNEHYSMTCPGSVYDEEALTALELAARTVKKVNECVDLVNQNESDVKNAIEEQIPATIASDIMDHIEGGTFDNQIDEHTAAVTAEVAENKRAMQSQLGNKVDKNGSGQITMNMLAQDVKTAMTGGSVAVVGDNAVATSNLQNKSVTADKLAPNISPIGVYINNHDYITPFLIIDGVAGTAEVNPNFNTGIRFITGNGYTEVTKDNLVIDVSKWTNHNNLMLWLEKETRTIHVTNYLVYMANYYLLATLPTISTHYETCIPVKFNDMLFTPDRTADRKLSDLIMVTHNTDDTKRIPYIDFNNGELVFPKDTQAFFLNGDGYFSAFTTSTEEYRVPFTTTAHQYLVGNTEELKFVNYDYFNNNMKLKHRFLLGYVNTNSKTWFFNFECRKKRSVSILGDSISTYAGYIPEGNACYYSGTNADVTHPCQTWWHRVMNRCGMVLNTNNSWSGARISGAGESAASVRATLLDNGTEPDVIIVYMGINDFNGGVPIGDYDCKRLPERNDVFKEAYALTLKNIEVKYPNAKIYAMTLPPVGRATSTNDVPEINSAGVALWEYNDAIRHVCRAFNVEVIDTESCQINEYNGSVNFGDYNAETDIFLHPNKTGMKKLASKVIKSILYSAE